MFLYTGAYTTRPDGRADGIGVYRFDPETGAIDHVQTVTGITNPSFLTLSADERFLYSVTEGDGEGTVAAFRRDPATGALEELNRQSSQGQGPCHVSVDHSGSHVLVANYNSGSIAALPIAGDGSLEPASSAIQHEGSSVRPDRQEGPHAHMIASSPEGNYVYATDLGLDLVLGYTLDTATGQLALATETATEPGAGPRHFAFSPNGDTMYVLNELGFTLGRYDYDAASGDLDHQQTVPTLPEGFNEFNLCAHVVVSPDGRFVYGSNRGHDSIATWSVNADTGELRLVERAPAGGRTPRNFALVPGHDLMLVANMDTDNVAVMPRDPDTGRLGIPIADHTLPSVCCLVFTRE